MPVNKPCFGVAYKEEPLVPGDLKRELLLDMLSDLVVGGLTKLYRKLYDNAMVNPEFSGDFIAVRGACAVAFTGESDTPREVVDLLQAEIERLRTVDDANELLRTALREENRAYVQIDPAE